MADAHFDQQGGGIPAQRHDQRRQAGLVLHRAQRRAVEQFDGGNRLRLQADHGFAGAANIREENQRARLERVFDDGMVGDARDEAERAFRADHQVTEDVERVFVIDQCVQAVTGGVLDLEFVADALGEPCICARVAAEAVDFAEQRAVALLEGGNAGGVFAVEHGAVGQHDAHSGERPVAVLGRAAAHAGGIVGGDAADLGGADRRRVGADFPAVRRETAIDFATDDAGTGGDLAGIGADFAGRETFADEGEHAVADRLAGEAGAGGAEGDRGAVLPCCGQHRFEVVFRFDDGDDFRGEAVEAGIGAVGEAAQIIDDDLVFREVLAEGLD